MIFELGIILQIEQNKQLKAVYMAPIKALVQELIQKWQQQFRNQQVVEFTSDINYKYFKKVFESNILICTPEKFDWLLRNWYKYKSFF